MQTPKAWFNGQWLPLIDVHLELNDWGVLQGAMVVDRLRTVDQFPLDLEEHAVRFLDSCTALAINGPTLPELRWLISECASQNKEAFGGKDFSIVLLATPGISATAAGGTSATDSVDKTRVAGLGTHVIYPVAMRWASLAKWYTHGQRLLIADACNVPSQCWSPQLKTRSRLQYFLADQQAAALGPHAGALLLDVQGNWTETSNANVLLVEGDRLVSPPLDSVLNGISLQRTLRLATAAGHPVRFEFFDSQRAARASEILLCGSGGCLWPASEIVAPCAESASLRTLRKFDDPSSLPRFQQLKAAWERDIGLDYIGQALAIADG